MLGFSCVKPIKTVYTVLEEAGALDLLREDLVAIATKEIYSEGRSRRDIQKDIKSKERAIEVLSSKYTSRDLSQEDLRQCLYSIGDNHAFLRTNRDPCDKMIGHLKEYFHATQAKDGKSSLAIRTASRPSTYRSWHSLHRWSCTLISGFTYFHLDTQAFDHRPPVFSVDLSD